MLSTFEIRKRDCKTRPNLIKFNQECKNIIMNEMDLSESQVAVHFQTDDLTDKNDGYVIGCRVETPLKIFYFIYDDVDDEKFTNFKKRVNAASKFDVEKKIEAYTTRIITQSVLVRGRGGKPVTDENGAEVYENVRERVKVYSVYNLQNILTQESKYPVDAKRYRTVLEAVKKHYEEMPEPERRKITGVEKKKFRKLMEDLNQAIEDLSRVV